MHVNTQSMRVHIEITDDIMKRENITIQIYILRDYLMKCLVEEQPNKRIVYTGLQKMYFHGQ